MANHGYIETDKNLSLEIVDKLAKEVNEKYFNNILKYNYEEEFQNTVFIIDAYNVIQYWISDKYKYGEKDENGVWFDYSEPKIISKNSVVEFRHGFGYDFMWWVESIFMNYIAEKLDGMISDDGVEEIWKPDLSKFLTSYIDYVKKCSYSKPFKWIRLLSLKSDFKYFKKKNDEESKRIFNFINQCCYGNKNKNE